MPQLEASKLVGYAIVDFPKGALTASKLVGYAVMDLEHAQVYASKLVAYAVMIRPNDVGRVIQFASLGTWNGSPTHYEFVTLRSDSSIPGSGVPIPGATGETYTVVQDDVGKWISRLVYAVNAAGTSHPVESNVLLIRGFPNVVADGAVSIPKQTAAGSADFVPAATGPDYDDPSYSNYGGSGSRARQAVMYSGYNAAGFNSFANWRALLDGNTSANGPYPGNNGTGQHLQWKFFNKVRITEAKWYQSSAVSHGTWKWRGSNDEGVSWTDIGPSFTLGGAALQTINALSGNDDHFYIYRLEQVSGNSNWNAYWREIEFKIDQIASGEPTFYDTASPLAFGDRSALIDVTLEGNWRNTSLIYAPALVDGTIGPGSGADTAYPYVNDEATSARAVFDFGSAIVLKGMLVHRGYFYDGDQDHGMWQIEGSKDNGASWTAVNSPQLMHAGTTFYEAWGNNAAYQLYSLNLVSGSTRAEYWIEVGFAVEV